MNLNELELLAEIIKRSITHNLNLLDQLLEEFGKPNIALPELSFLNGRLIYDISTHDVYFRSGTSYVLAYTESVNDRISEIKHLMVKDIPSHLMKPDVLGAFMYVLMEEARRNSLIDLLEDYELTEDDYKEVAKWFKQFDVII